jgi:hypothetical protein
MKFNVYLLNSSREYFDLGIKDLLHLKVIIFSPKLSLTTKFDLKSCNEAKEYTGH